jgi:hypothetical protein
MVSATTSPTSVPHATAKTLAIKTQPQRIIKWEGKHSYAALSPADDKEGRLEDSMNT